VGRSVVKRRQYGAAAFQTANRRGIYRVHDKGEREIFQGPGKVKRDVSSKRSRSSEVRKRRSILVEREECPEKKDIDSD